ncbi:MAG: substrate-binding domain-containing protein [Beijerinckiaceae bacterium]|nr:substrate-binding domain-containing protein [Beijerinckiaceae bacterium]
MRGVRALQGSLEARLQRPLEIETDHGHNIIMRMGMGMGFGEPPADAVLLPRDMIDALVFAGRLAPRVVDIGEVATSAVVCAGAAAPDVSTMDALREALVRASCVLLTTAPSGKHMGHAIEALGVAQEVAPKIQRFDRSSQINDWLAREKNMGALGFGPATEIVGVEGVTHAGFIAREAQMVLPYAAAITDYVAHDPAAQQFLDFLKTDEAREAFAETGVRF